MIIKTGAGLVQAESEDHMDEYMNNENNTRETQSENTQNSGQYNNGAYQGNDWQNGGFNNGSGSAGQENGAYGSSYGGGYGNGGYGSGGYGGYSDSGRQPGRRLRRSATNRMVCGVCAGIAEYFNWDPTIIRIIWVAASIFLGAGFLGVIAYFIVAVIMPER